MRNVAHPGPVNLPSPGSGLIGKMTKAAARLSLALVALLLVGLGSFLVVVVQPAAVPPQPQYDGRELLQWLTAQPQQSLVSHEDIVGYRRVALTNMGDAAVGYLTWMIRNPHLCLREHSTPWDRMRDRLPEGLKAAIPAPPINRADFMGVVVALQLIGPKARMAVPDLLRLWDSNGNPGYATYNGFPMTLAALGDRSPVVRRALHRRFSSPDRLHRAVCALAAWQLDPGDSEADARVRAELGTTDHEDHTRYALLAGLSGLGPEAATFRPEVEGLIARSDTAETWKRTEAARAAWRILHSNRPATALLQQLGTVVAGGNCSKGESDEFCAAASGLREIPGVQEIAIPHLVELSEHPNPSAASFASAVLARVRASGSPETKAETQGGERR